MRSHLPFPAPWKLLLRLLTAQASLAPGTGSAPCLPGPQSGAATSRKPFPVGSKGKSPQIPAPGAAPHLCAQPRARPWGSARSIPPPCSPPGPAPHPPPSSPVRRRRPPCPRPAGCWSGCERCGSAPRPRGIRTAALTLRFLEICTAMMSRGPAERRERAPRAVLYPLPAAPHWLAAARRAASGARWEM